MGPFDIPPFKLHTSPFLTRDKSSSDKRRVIVDLSWPLENSVNDAVRSDSYLDTTFLLTLPTIDHVIKGVKKFGKNSCLAKIDISRAFKHIPIDPKDLQYLGLFWEAFYIELNLVFGFKLGSAFFQRFSDSLRFILTSEGHYCVNYIDDYVLFGNEAACSAAFERLQKLLAELGLDISVHKNVPSATKVTCLGVLVNTEDFTVSVPPEKLEEIKNLCRSWAKNPKCI